MFELGTHKFGLKKPKIWTFFFFYLTKVIILTLRTKISTLKTKTLTFWPKYPKFWLFNLEFTKFWLFYLENPNFWLFYLENSNFWHFFHLTKVKILTQLPNILTFFTLKTQTFDFFLILKTKTFDCFYLTEVIILT